MKGILPYVGGKHRIAPHIVRALREVAQVGGCDTLVDVFGGSGAVTMAAEWGKRVYNDTSGDLVNLFRVLASPGERRRLLQRLRWVVPSRQTFEQDSQIYLAGGFSFAGVACPVERAAKTFVRSHFCFGGKNRNGGFSVSIRDAHGIKEVVRWANVLRRLAAAGEFWRATLVECLDFAAMFDLYGSRAECVLFCDPPYDGTERYYSGALFASTRHAELAALASSCSAQVVMTYYETPRLRDLYPEPAWEWRRVETTKNSQWRAGNKTKVDEYILLRRLRAPATSHGPQLKLLLEA